MVINILPTHIPVLDSCGRAFHIHGGPRPNHCGQVGGKTTDRVHSEAEGGHQLFEGRDESCTGALVAEIAPEKYEII